MRNIGRGVLVLYAIAMLLGGIAGYASKGSVPSLVAGIATAVLILPAVLLTRQNAKAGFGMGAVVAFVLTAVFMHRYSVGHEARNIGLCVFSLCVGLFSLVTANAKD